MYAPMKMGFPTGMAGGGITQFLQPLQEYLSQQVVQQQVQPFIAEVSDEAQERFNLGGTGSNDILSNNIFDNNMFQGNSGGIGTQLPGPRIPTFLGTGNDGFGSASQGPLDFFTAQIPKYEKGFDDAGLSNEPMPIMGGYTGQPMQLPYDSTPMNPLIFDSLAGAGGLPDFAGSAQSYFNPGMGGQSEFGPMGATSEQMVGRARDRLAQRDVKPPEVQAYLNHIIQTGGNPTMMAPPPQMNKVELDGPALISQPGFGDGTMANLFQLPSVGPASAVNQ